MKRRRKVKKRVVFPILFLFLLLAGFIGLKVTENGTYTIENLNNGNVKATYHHYIFAKIKMDTIDKKAICIKNEDGKVLRLKSGIVNLHTKDVTENTSYTTDNNEEGYTNGSYGADAQYLGTSLDGKKVHFKISGVSAWTDIDNVTLYLYSDSLNISYYYIYQGSLVHTISTDIESGTANTLSIGIAPDFLKDDTYYYSYDGHYFYTSFNKLTKDKPINDEPYYNYYQYVPHRTTSTLTNNDYNTYLEKYGIADQATAYPCLDSQSILYNQGDLFNSIQSKYSINAAMMYSLALNESGIGKSQYAIEYHNLFGHAAIDSNPDAANQYNSIEECIQQHAYNFLQQGYANPNDERYHGSWFGDKASGINVNYASDPYWGEKAASFYYKLDSDRQDYNSNSIKTIQLTHDLNVYASDKKTVLYSYDKGEIVSIHVLDEDSNYYTISSEAPIKNNEININKTYRNDKAYIKIKNWK